MPFTKGHPYYPIRDLNIKEAWKKKISHAHKGKKLSKTTKEKISLIQRGRKLSIECKLRHSVGAKRAGCGKWMKGRKLSKTTRDKMSKYRREHPDIFAVWRGKKQPISMRINQSLAQKKRCFEGRHNNYKGGITEKSKKIRNSLEYRLWREAVFRRDDWTCRFCGERGGVLHADHIKPFAQYPELRFSIDNGRTLCIECHKTTDTYLNRKNGLSKEIRKEYID